jgi:hypothetical protein
VTAPGERLTPQQMRAEWDKRFPFTSAISADPYQAAGFVERVLAAWQADREVLEDARQTSKNTAHLSAKFQEERATYYEQTVALRALLRRAREALDYLLHNPVNGQSVARSVLAELDAAQGEESR